MQATVRMLSAALRTGFAAGAQAADVQAGEIVFNKCRQCHRIGPGATNFYGPSLNGLIDRKAGTFPGYNYSEANKHSGIVWTKAALESYLRQPQHDVPATYMTFKGLDNQADIDNVIAYIAQFQSSGGKQ